MAHDVWSELGESPELQEALEGLRAEQMPESVAEQILSTLPPGGGGGQGPPSVGRGSAASSLSSWAVAAAVVAAVLAAGWLWQTSSAATAAPSGSAEAGAAADLVEPPARGDEGEATELREPAPAPLRVEPAPTSDDESSSIGVTQQPERDVGASPRSRPEPPNPRDEIELLERARASLPAHPREASRLLRRHARAFPHSQLAQERELLRVEAAVAAGQSARARRLADAFLRRYPRSAQRARVEALRARATR